MTPYTPVAAKVIASNPNTASATAGQTLVFPHITLQHTGPILNGKLAITLPAGLAFSSISAGSLTICSGTSIIECSLDSWAANADSLQVDLTLTATTAGSYSVPVHLTAANETNTTNNDASVDLQIELW